MVAKKSLFDEYAKWLFDISDLILIEMADIKETNEE